MKASQLSGLGLFLQASHETFCGSQPLLKGLVSIVSSKLLLCLLAPSLLFWVLSLLLGAAVPPASLGGVPFLPAKAAPLSCWKLLLLPLAFVGLRLGRVSFAAFLFLDVLFSSPCFAFASLLKLFSLGSASLSKLFSLGFASSARAVGKLVRLPLAFAGWRLGCVSSPFSLASFDKLVRLVLFLFFAEGCCSGGPLCYVLQAFLLLCFLCFLLRSRPWASWSLVLQTC